jgi:hypothetical protein
MPKILLANINKRALPLSGLPTEERQQLEIYTADSMARAEALLRTERFAVVLVEGDFDDGPVSELCDRIRQDAAMTKVAILGLAWRSDRRRIRLLERSRVSEVITRPLDVDEFCRILSKLLHIAVRRPVKLLARVSSAKGASDFFAHCLNISQSGVLLLSPQRLKVGTHAQCTFFLPDSLNRIAATLEVIRQTAQDEGFAIGAQFCDISPENQALIASFVSAGEQGQP